MCELSHPLILKLGILFYRRQTSEHGPREDGGGEGSGLSSERAGRVLQRAKEHQGWGMGCGARKIDKGERREWKRSVCLFL